MNLENIMHISFTIMMTTVLLMLWLAYAQASVCQFDPFCSCSSTSSHLGHVECKDTPANIPSLNTSKLFTLTLINNDISYLPPNLFFGTGLYKLRINNNPIYYMHEEALTGLERSLWEIHITQCKLTSVPGNAIRHLYKLKTLNLTGNAITTVVQEQLKGVAASLQNLILAENDISTLPPGVFSSLHVLETLDIRGNAILTLDPGVFTPPPSKLKYLDLSDNLIEVISYKQLANLKMLHSLNLNKNKLTNLADPASQVKLFLDTLYLEHNKIEELVKHSMINFEVANHTSFEGNPIASIQPNAFQGCRILDLNLANCKLSAIDDESFNGLENSLQNLDLTGNNITTFTYPLFLKYDNLRSLNLDYNNLKDVEWMKPPENSNQDVQLIELHLTGRTNSPLDGKKLPKLVHLQSLSASNLHQPNLAPIDFDQFSVELETLRITEGNLRSLEPNTFKFVRGIKTLDLTDNSISKIDSKCLNEISHSLETLILTHSFDKSITNIPRGMLKNLSELKTLKLNHNNLFKLPNEIQFLSSLEILHAQDNSIGNIPKGIFKAEVHKNLKEINLSFNSIPKIVSHTFHELDELVEINLSDNAIVTVESGAFVNLNKVDSIYLRGNRIHHLPPEVFQNLPALSTLDLAFNSLTYFNFACLDQVGMLSTLTVNISHNLMHILQGNSSFNGGRFLIFTDVKVLDMSHNNISSVDKSYFIPVQHSLAQLYMSHNVLPNATRDLFPEMPHLQLLDMSHNQMFEIEFDALRSLKNIQVIILSHNNLKSIPIGLFHSLTSVRHIDLSYNKLHLLFDSIISPQSLISADLSHNNLIRVPLTAFSPSAATNLVELSLRNNKITSLPSPESFSRFARLRYLDISSNKVTDLGNSFTLLSNLKTLIVANNFLHIGSKDFNGLEHCLEHLDISNVSISYVPPLPLPSLLTLKMSRNMITFIPFDLQANLTNLKDLDISYNLLQSIPELPQLSRLNLAGNQISTINNTSFTDFPHLVELDIRRLPLKEFSLDALVPLQYLETLRLSNYLFIQNFNAPKYIREINSLRTLHFEAVGLTNIGIEMSGALSEKISHVIISGKELKSLPDNLLAGVQSEKFKFSLTNTSVETLQSRVFPSNIRSLTVDLTGSELTSMGNPSNAGGPNRPRTTFLTDFHISGDKWTCDCKLGWIETWQRKRRQVDPHDYTIEDVRDVKCKNKQNKPLLSILKSEMECGWSGGSKNSFSILLIFSLTVFKLITS